MNSSGDRDRDNFQQSKKKRNRVQRNFHMYILRKINCYSTSSSNKLLVFKNILFRVCKVSNKCFITVEFLAFLYQPLDQIKG